MKCLKKYSWLAIAGVPVLCVTHAVRRYRIFPPKKKRALFEENRRAARVSNKELQFKVLLFWSSKD